MNLSTCAVLSMSQHPVTLNVAVPKGYTWTQRKVLGQSGSPEDQRPLTVPERNLVATFFADMMVHDNSTQHDQRYANLTSSSAAFKPGLKPYGALLGVLGAQSVPWAGCPRCSTSTATCCRIP